LKYTI